MKKVVLVAFLALFSTVTVADDLLKLSNGMIFNGEVRRVKSCEILFKTSTGEKYWIPGGDIAALSLAGTNKRAYQQFLKVSADQEACMAGKLDAEELYGKKGMFFMAGCLLGWVGPLLAYMIDHSPESSDNTMEASANAHLFSDPDYLRCYEKTAKRNSMKSAVTGMVVSYVAAGLLWVVAVVGTSGF